MKEKWVDVLGFENCYQVSNTGKVRSKTRTHRSRNKWNYFDRTIKGKELKLNKNPNGYLVIELYDIGRFTKRGVHTIVYESFNGTPLKRDHVIHHKDGSRNNNSIDNLEMLSFTEHNRHHSHEPWNKGIKTDKRTNKKMILSRSKTMLLKSEKAIELRDFWGLTIEEIAIEMGVVSRCVYDYINKKEYYIKKIKRLENELSE